jgi:hypothetical protein
LSSRATRDQAVGPTSGLWTSTKTASRSAPGTAAVCRAASSPLTKSSTGRLTLARSRFARFPEARPPRAGARDRIEPGGDRQRYLCRRGALPTSERTLPMSRKSDKPPGSDPRGPGCTRGWAGGRRLPPSCCSARCEDDLGWASGLQGFLILERSRDGTRCRAQRPMQSEPISLSATRPGCAVVPDQHRSFNALPPRRPRAAL